MHLDLWQVENQKRTMILKSLPPVLMIMVSKSRFLGTAYYSGLKASWKLSNVEQQDFFLKVASFVKARLTCAAVGVGFVHAFVPMASGELEAHQDSVIFAACSHDYRI